MSSSISPNALIEAARKAQIKSHSPYSNYRVGAALLTESGEVYSACNIEAKPSANTLHAEQRAMALAVEDGHEDFVALALVTDGDNTLPPCGNCRQTLATFQEDLTIYVEAGHTYHEYVLDDLLPAAYTGRSTSDAPTNG